MYFVGFVVYDTMIYKNVISITFSNSSNFCIDLYGFAHSILVKINSYTINEQLFFKLYLCITYWLCETVRPPLSLVPTYVVLT